MFGCGWVVTLVTVLFMPEEQIWFGVLTLIGSCMLLMVPLEKLLRHVPVGVGLAASAALFTLLRNVNQGTLGFEDWTLGTVPEGLYRNLLTAYIGFPPPDGRADGAAGSGRAPVSAPVCLGQAVPAGIYAPPADSLWGAAGRGCPAGTVIWDRI